MNRNHLISTIITILIVNAILYFIDRFTQIEISTVVYVMTAVLGFVSYLFGEWIAGAINERPALYVNRYMMSFLMKMLGFLAFLVLYLKLVPGNTVNIALSLFASYVIFSAHMVVFLKKA